MAQIFWTSDLETGLQDIDEQKQQIFNQINTLHSTCDKQDDFAINVALFDLISSTMNHFSYEEEMLAESGYHLLEPHKRVHQNFMDKLVETQMKVMENSNEINELLPILNEWWLRHIRLNDMGYVDFVLKSGVYKKNKHDKWVRSSGADKAQFSQVAFEGWENQNANSENQAQPHENAENANGFANAQAENTPVAENAPEPNPQPSQHETQNENNHQQDIENKIENFVRYAPQKPITSSSSTSQWARLVDEHDKRQREIAQAIKKSDDDDAPRGWASHY